MEETSGAVVNAPFGESPFSELISRWLDEGDRLSASAAAAPPSPATESRLGQVVLRLQPLFARHRLSVLVGIGLVPVLLFLCTHRVAPAPVASGSAIVTTAILAPVTSSAPTSPGDPMPPMSSAEADVSPVEAPASLASVGSAELTPPMSLASVGSAELTPPMSLASAGSAELTPPASLASAGSAELTPPHRHHHHHHHHHAASAPGKAVASAPHTARR